MKVLALEKTALTVSDLVELAKEGPVVLTRNGEPVAAVNDLYGCDREAVSLANNPQFLALIEEARRSYREQGGVALDELRKELGVKPPRRQPRRKKRT